MEYYKDIYNNCYRISKSKNYSFKLEKSQKALGIHKTEAESEVILGLAEGKKWLWEWMRNVYLKLLNSYQWTLNVFK